MNGRVKKHAAGEDMLEEKGGKMFCIVWASYSIFSLISFQFIPLSSGAFSLMLVYGECAGCSSRRLKASLSAIKTAGGRIREHATNHIIKALLHSRADGTG